MLHYTDIPPARPPVGMETLQTQELQGRLWLSDQGLGCLLAYTSPA